MKRCSCLRKPLVEAPKPPRKTLTESNNERRGRGTEWGYLGPEGTAFPSRYSEDCCQLKAVECDASTAREMKELELPENNIKGFTSPHELGELEHLQRLDLHDNLIEDASDFCWSKRALPSLYHLDLSVNNLTVTIKFSGSFPSSLVHNLTSIESLILSWNRFTGEVSFSIFANLSTLGQLDISYNADSVPIFQHSDKPINMMFPVDVSHCQMKQKIERKLRAFVSCLSYRHLISSNPMTYGKVQLDDDDDVAVMVGLHQSSDNNMVEMYVEATNATDIPTLSVPARRTQEAGPPKPHASYGDENLVGRFSESLFEFSEYDEDIVPLVDDDDTTLVDESDFFEVASDGQDLDVEADITSQPATSTFFFPLTTMVSLHCSRYKKAKIAELQLYWRHTTKSSIIGRYWVCTKLPDLSGSKIPPINIIRYARVTYITSCSADCSATLNSLSNHVIYTRNPSMTSGCANPGTRFPGIRNFRVDDFSARVPTRMLRVPGNNLSGDVSDSIDNITSWTKGAEPPDAEIIAAGIIPFTVLDLSCNRLTGSIPMQITQLKTLGVLNMSRNLLSGQIPISLRNLEALEVLDLSYNNLFGELHPELTALTTTYGGRY
ncbi:hypothetical protein F3Y22_tig00111835pilonHSYRG00040 [Hibiscus syriacus]|uniref:Uncharacterized protein n=1 Tax=Hibiscus syriacus TaxID=106335 RepID=A0A6A2XZ52_HIBSY|nr:hypothetical protein F3Y22_tig00111835pilonHSYRG00040 [Hibiscus syriacus]